MTNLKDTVLQKCKKDEDMKVTYASLRGRTKEEYLWGRTYREEEQGRQDSFYIKVVLHRSPTVGALVSANSQFGEGNYGSNGEMYFLLIEYF